MQGVWIPWLGLLLLCVYNHTEAIPEQPEDEELKIVMQQIAQKNASILASHDKEFNNTWSLEFFPNENTCTLCRTPLGALEHVPGSNSSTFLLTRVKMLPAKAWIKRCPNTKCLARHSYHSWKEGLEHVAKYMTVLLKLYLQHLPGVFNASNKLFVTLDVLFEMRSHIQQGEPVHNCAHSVIQGSTYSCGVKIPLNEQELWYLERILYNGYFAFEALTRRDWNHSICGICGSYSTHI